MKKLLVVFAMLTLVGVALAQRTLPPINPGSDSRNTPGYCNSTGGSTSYEAISNVTWEISGSTISFQVDLYIANPTGCTAGNPCPEYDTSPEYVNGWVDFNGNQVWEPSEQVINLALTGYTNINYSGTMTGYAQATIPPNAVQVTYLRVNLGWGFDPQDPCTPTWSWGNVLDYQITFSRYNITQLDVENGNEILELLDGVVWERHFDADCNISNGKRSFNDYPICVPRNGPFSLRAVVSSCPAGDQPRIECDYSYSGVSLSGNIPEADGWERVLSLPAPNAVGVYTLTLDFEITIPGTDQDQVINETITRRVLVTYDDAINEPGKRKWYEKGCTWAQGATTENAVANAVLGGIYNTTWRYGYYFGPVTKANWHQLVEDVYDYADCHVFSDVLQNISNILGVGGFSTRIPQGSNSQGFVTVNGAPSLDPAFPGNTKPAAGGGYDRYLFGNHNLLLKGGTYYDATFNRTYGTETQFISWNLNGSAGGFLTTSEGALIRLLAGDSYDSWGNSEYTPPPSQNAVGDEIASRLTDAYASLDSDALSFTGNVVFGTVDANGDGYFDALTADVECDVTVAGDYSIYGTLAQGGSMVSNRPSYFSMQFSHDSYSGAPGTIVAHLEFSGEQIYQFGADGPYDLELVAISMDGAEDSLTAATSAYVHTAFGELGLSLSSANAVGVDTDMDGLFNLLRTTVGTQVRTAGNYTVLASLVHGAVVIAAESVPATLAAGAQDVIVDFPGKKIRQSSLNGPYEILISVQDSTGTVIASETYATGNLLANEFEIAVAPTGTHSDFGMDTNSNGLYDILRVQLDVSADSAGDYTIAGWLETMPSPLAEAGDPLGFAQASVSLGVGMHTITLDFPGTAISASGVNGPYVLANLEVLAADNSSLGSFATGYETDPYSYSAFEGAPSPVEYLGFLGTTTTDPDFDGLANELIAELQVRFDQNGVVLGFAALRDSDGRIVAQGAGFAPVVAGVPTAIPVKFDGRYIFGNLRNGPYQIINGFLYPSIDIALGVNVPFVGNTATYSYTDFEPAAVITGIVQSTTSGQFAVGAGLTSLEATDFVDDNGHYRLIYLTGGTKDVTLSIPAFPDATWEIYHNGLFLGMGNNAVIDVAVGEIDTVDFLTDHPLPVELLSFGAQPGDGEVEITWSTASEQNNERFELLRDGVLIARLDGAGTTASRNDYSYRDSGLPNDRAVTYALFAVDMNGARSFAAETSTMPRAGLSVVNEFTLRQNYPNPFNPETFISFTIPEAGDVKLEVFDLQGRSVALLLDQTMTAGNHEIRFNAVSLPTGIYWYRLTAGTQVSARKMLLLK
ncbi:MAG: T9SS type A sorting domain-containing protein [bacterium]|nr:T9SS type A sorting domain-containing protein [bacterium]